MQIILEVPDRLGKKLQQLGDQLPETLERLLQDIPTPETISYQESAKLSKFWQVSPALKQSSPSVLHQLYNHG